MEIDAKKLETAILYLQRMTEGKNPVNNMSAEDDSIINNPNVVRCMSFVKDVLEEVKEKGWPQNGKKPDFPLETLDAFKYSEDVGITKLISQFNECADMDLYNKLSITPLKRWLIENGYLTEVHDAGSNTKASRPTEKGNDIGIKTETRTRPNGDSYVYVTYSQKAQEMIVANRNVIFEKR